ncbi:MAG: hypothetical protein ACLGIK_09735, partial [Gemmatimonadota bacterium]
MSAPLDDSAPAGAPRIVPLRGPDDAAACARIMCTSEPWITLGRDFDRALAIVQLTDQEAYVALDDGDAVAARDGLAGEGGGVDEELFDRRGADDAGLREERL